MKEVDHEGVRGPDPDTFLLPRTKVMHCINVEANPTGTDTTGCLASAREILCGRM